RALVGRKNDRVSAVQVHALLLPPCGFSRRCSRAGAHRARLLQQLLQIRQATLARAIGACSMKVLVTGAAGFIGMHVAERMRRDGAEVVGVDSFDPYYDVGLKRARARRLEDAG